MNDCSSRLSVMPDTAVRDAALLPTIDETERARDDNNFDKMGNSRPQKTEMIKLNRHLLQLHRIEFEIE